MHEEIMTMDVNDACESVQALAHTLAQCAIALYEMAEEDISLQVETKDGKRIEIALRGIGGESDAGDPH